MPFARRLSRFASTLLLTAAAIVAAGCAGAARSPRAPAQPLALPPPAAAAAAPLAAYVLLVESPDHQPVPLARVIVASGQACPQLVGGKSPIAMRKRLNPHGFTVDVCEAAIPFGRALRVVGGPALPVARRRVHKVAVVGDTGCKPSDQSGCGLDDPAWPFPALARAAAAGRPDLVLHVGDYNYRGTPSSFQRTVRGQPLKTYYYDAGDGAQPAERCEVPGPYYSQNSTGNTDADAWEPWWLDFFQPAAPLLAAAPWIVARGNHELCSHAGPGWFYFFDPSSQLPEGGGVQAACPSQDGEGPALPHLAFVAPQVIALDGLSIAVLDSANACDELTNFTERYREQLASLAARLQGHPAWLVGHRPFWGVEGTAPGPPVECDNSAGRGAAQTYAVLNRTLQCALAGAPELLPKLDLLLFGHMHRYESVTFAAGSGRPPQLVIGNGGVLEDSGPPSGSFQQLVDGLPATGFSVEQFGFLRLEQDGAGPWRGAVVTPEPQAWSGNLPTCGSTEARGAFLCVQALPGEPEEHD